MTSARAAPIRLLTLMLIAANVGALGILLCNAWFGTQTAALLATPAKPFAIPELKLQPVAQIMNIASLQEEPLFYASRHFYRRPAPSEVPAIPPKPDYRLVGTFVIPSKPTVALLFNSTGSSRKVKSGDDLDGWTVQSVESGRVLLQYQGQSAEISSGGKGGSAGMQVVPLSSSARTVPQVGVRSLSTVSLGHSVAPGAGTTASSTPRFYRPPPK